MDPHELDFKQSKEHEKGKHFQEYEFDKDMLDFNDDNDMINVDSAHHPDKVKSLANEQSSNMAV
eukprot:CAMPEP_0116898166 /NCGR_PEP_ID=MMETSP0467-20121206/6937_1 /TAXON_ID=283647 /ORGANISM="Mesodinium pulex, Strain SPMC105" /LENGTH=63 /DNA_ID=CAMNT_0004570119 /DNA_START=311 /DNA_END=502 /DNA_ORIENTATION=-